MKKYFLGLLSLLLCMLFPGILGYLAGYLALGLIVGLIFWVIIILVFFQAYILGAEYALKNPPKVGKPWIDLKLGYTVIWSSKKFTFKPTFKSSYKKNQHRRIWLKVKEDHSKGLSPNQIIDHLKLKMTDDTLRTIIKKGDNGELD